MSVCKRLAFKLRYIFFFICFLFSIISFFFIVRHIKNSKKEEKKAIIFVPGIGGSELFYNGTENKDYSKNRALLVPNELTFFGATRFIEDIEAIVRNSEILACDENGLSINKDVGLLQDINNATTKDVNLHKYGVFHLFKNLMNILNYLFGEKTRYKRDVFLFNYDWRLSCSTNGDLLTKVIEKYDKVTLIGYSMGGLLSCRAMSNLFQQSKLDKIENYISVCVPYNGAVLSLYALLTGFIEENKILNFFYQNLGCAETVKKLLKNYPSIYELLPTEEYFSRSKGYFINKSGTLLDYQQTIDFIEKNSDLNNSLLKKAILFHKSLFVNQKHILEYLKNKYFIVGDSYYTASEIKQNNNIYISAHKEGDKTVEFTNSAIPAVRDAQSLNIYKIKSTHFYILNNDQFLAQITYLLDNNLSKK